jgi:hypothetical protein
MYLFSSFSIFMLVFTSCKLNIFVDFVFKISFEISNLFKFFPVSFLCSLLVILPNIFFFYFTISFLFAASPITYNHNPHPTGKFRKFSAVNPLSRSIYPFFLRYGGVVSVVSSLFTVPLSTVFLSDSASHCATFRIATVQK